MSKGFYIGDYPRMPGSVRDRGIVAQCGGLDILQFDELVDRSDPRVTRYLELIGKGYGASDRQFEEKSRPRDNRRVG